jgi:hypothetical protein
MEKMPSNPLIERYRRLLKYGPDDELLRKALRELLAEEEALAAALIPPPPTA